MINQLKSKSLGSNTANGLIVMLCIAGLLMAGIELHNAYHAVVEAVGGNLPAVTNLVLSAAFVGSFLMYLVEWGVRD